MEQVPPHPSLYVLRRHLQVVPFVLGTAEIRLHAELIGSDAAEFVAARRTGELGRAVALYAGPGPGRRAGTSWSPGSGRSGTWNTPATC
jgi:hypothetical protein